MIAMSLTDLIGGAEHSAISLQTKFVPCIGVLEQADVLSEREITGLQSADRIVRVDIGGRSSARSSGRRFVEASPRSHRAAGTGARSANAFDKSAEVTIPVMRFVASLTST